MSIRTMPIEERRAYHRERMRIWRESPENKAKCRAYARQYRLDNLDKARENNRAFNKRRQEETPEYFIFHRAKRRAKQLGLPFNIEVSDIKIPKKCPALGIELCTHNPKGKSLRNSPSLDRIVPELGYTKGNIVVVSHKANSIKNDATPDEIIAVGKFYETIKRQTSCNI